MFAVDEDALFVTGASNGGMFMHYLLSQLPSTFKVQHTLKSCVFTRTLVHSYTCAHTFFRTPGCSRCLRRSAQGLPGCATR
jgi:hypothetical protein